MAESVSISLRVVEQFFDRRAVQQRIDKAKRKQLSKQGAFVRRQMRGSLRRRKRTSRPGEKPSIHTKGDANLKKILFAFEPETETVVVGPVKFNAVGEDVPAVLEFGGTATVMSGGRRSRKKRRVHVAARPFAFPALEEVQRKNPALFEEDSI